MMSRAVIAALLIVFGCFTKAHSMDAEVELWMRLLKDRPSKGIVAAIADRTTPAWPEIRTKYWIQKLPENERAAQNNRAEMPSDLLDRVREDFVSESPKSFEELDALVAKYTGAAERIVSNDSYSNRLIADRFYKVVYYYLSGWLIAHPADFDEISRRVNALSIPQPDLVVFYEKYHAEDPVLDAATIRIQDIDKGGNLLQQIASINVQREVWMGPLIWPFDFQSKAMLLKPSVVALLESVAATSSDFKSVLALCEYLKKGGGMADRDFMDLKKFRAIMGNDAKQYARAWDGKVEFDPLIFRAIRRLHSEPSYREYFLRMVFE